MEGVSLEEIKRDFGGALLSIDAREIPPADLHRVTRYGAKLLERVPSSLAPEELWSIMPRSLAEGSEPSVRSAKGGAGLSQRHTVQRRSTVGSTGRDRPGSSHWRPV